LRSERAEFGFNERGGFSDLVEIVHGRVRMCAVGILQGRRLSGGEEDGRRDVESLAEFFDVRRV
jgi:hypothetical protein